MLKSDYIYSISGLLIIHMIFYHIRIWSHVDYCLFYQLIDRIFFFFMPWFFFKSGMFYKNRTCQQTFKSGIKKLIYPFIIYSILGHILFCFKIYIEGDKNWIHYILSPIKSLLLQGAVAGNAALWFLPSLFIVKLIGQYLIQNNQKNFKALLRKRNQYREYFWLLLLISVSYLHFLLFKGSYFVYIGNISSGLVFYLMGYKLCLKQYDKKIYLISFLIILTFYCFYPIYVDMRSNNLITGTYLLWYPASIAGIITWNNIFKRLPYIHILNWIGIRSMDFYIIHWIVLLATTMVYDLLEIQNYYYISLIISCTLVLPLFSILKNRFFMKISNL